MKLFKFLLVTTTSLFFFYSQSAFAAYGTDDVPNDDGAKAQNYGAELEINEFVRLDAMPDIELYYYPYSATDADESLSEDVPGGAGSVYVGGGEIRWHANIDTTIRINDFTLYNIDTAVTERNEIDDTSVFMYVNSAHVSGTTAVAALDFDEGNISATLVSEMSGDMTSSYDLTADSSTENFDTDVGHTDFATKFYLRVVLGDTGSVQGAGDYRATLTVVALPNVSG
jgi:hypothetical protein